MRTDEELEEIDAHMQSSSSSEDEDNTEETEVTFPTRRTKDSSHVFDFTGPHSGITRSVAPDINAESSIVNLHALLQSDFSTYTRRDKSLLPQIHAIQKHSKHFSTIT